MENSPSSSPKGLNSQQDLYSASFLTKSSETDQVLTVESLLQRLKEINLESCDKLKISEEFLYHVKAVIANSPNPAKDLFEIFQAFLHHDFFLKEKFNELTRLLIEAFNELNNKKSSENSAKFFFLLYELLLKCTEKIEFSKNRERFEADFDKVTMDLSDFVINLDSLEIFSGFFSVLFKALGRGLNSSMTKKILSKKCVLSTIKVLKKSLKYCKLDGFSIEEPIEIFYFFIQNYTGDIENLQILEVFRCLNKRKIDEFAPKVIDVLINKVQESMDLKNSEKLKKLILSLLIEQKVSVRISQMYYERILEFGWEKEKLTNEFVAEIKALLLASSQVERKKFMLDLIFPWISEEFSVSELKLITKTCTIVPELAKKFFSSIFEASKKCLACPSHFLVSKDSSILFTVDFTLPQSREFSIWTKFFFESLKKMQTFLIMQANKSTSLLFYIEKNCFKIEIIKNSKEKYILLSINIEFLEKSWNLIGFSFNLRQKHNGKFKFILTINQKIQEVYLDEIGNFRSINSIEILGHGKLEFFNIYSAVLHNEYFNSIDKPINDAKHFEILKFNSTNKRPECAVLIKFTSKAQYCYQVSLFSLFKSIGSVNFIIPVLKNSTESSTVELFFKILAGMSENIEFRTIFDEHTFHILRFILNEKASLMTFEWLDAIEGFLTAFSQSPLYPSALNNLYLNPVLWSNLTENCLICYLEAVKTHLLSPNYPLNESNLPIISSYFYSLGNTLDYKYKTSIFYYYFQILATLFSKLPKESQVPLLTDIIYNVFEFCNIDEISEELGKFFSALTVQCWVCLQTDNLLQLIQCFFKYNEKVNGFVRCKFIMLFLNLCKEYWLKTGEKMNSEFLNKSIHYTWLLIGDQLDASICQGIIEFVADKRIAKSVLAETINIVTEKLIASHETQASEILQILNNFIDRASLVYSLSSQSAFPGWVLILLKKNPQSILIEILIKCFSLKKNFGKLKLVIIELISIEHYSTVFYILQKVFEKAFFGKHLHAKLRAKLMKFFNLVEDTVIRIDYKKMPEKNFVSFIKSCVLPLKTLQFSTSFPNLPGFGSFALFERDKKEENIVLREGGLARQLVYFILYGMSFAPDAEIEDFLKVFLEEKSNSETRVEWNDLKDLKMSQLVPKGKQKNINDLMFLFIFIEWAEIIRVLRIRGCKNDELLTSINNLTAFVKAGNLCKRIERQAKICLDKPGFKDFSRVLSDNFCNLSFEFLPEFAAKYEVMQRFAYKSESFENKLRLEETERHETFKLSIKNYTKSLANSIKENKLASFLDLSQDNIQIEAFIKVLTTLKLKKIFAFYMSSSPVARHYNYFRQSMPDFFPLNELKKQQLFNISADITIQGYIKRILRDHDLFCGKFNIVENGKNSLKSSFDYQGRRFLIKKKVSSLNIRNNVEDVCESLMSSVNYSGVINEKYEESIPGEDLQDNFCADDPEETYLSSSLSLLAEFDCEIIYIKGSLYGVLNIFENSIVFTSKSTEKPQMKPVVIIDNKPSLCSSALPDSQIKKKVKKVWPVSQIKELMYKKFIHNWCAIEFYFKSGKSYLINFFTKSKLQEVYSTLKQNYLNKGIIFMNKKQLKDYQESWQSGKISNFEYLMILNKYSSRSFHNLAQYPIFPWVLKDYSSEKLNLKSEESFRNLMYPVSAQTEECKKRSQSTFNLSKQGFDRPYHFGTHYSAGGIILHYLLRIQPFTSEALNLHRGTFDIPDRIFASMKKSWNSTQSSTSDTKELIPEFFYLPEMFINTNCEKFGIRQGGKWVNDVNFPAWAKNNVFLFLYRHRQALESEYVSKNLHLWIDLIFGFRQFGRKAEEFCNVFHPITYSHVYENTVIEAPENYLFGYYCQAMHYGQIPRQLFETPHPRRENCEVKESLCEELLKNKGYECQIKFSFKSEIIPLSCSAYFIFISVEEEIFMFRCKWSFNTVDGSSAKKIKLAGVFPTSRLMAGIYDDKFIVTSGYSDFSIVLHDFNGIVVNTLYFHSMTASDLQCGKWIVSGSLDSTLVVWTESEKILLQGHISPVYSVSGIFVLKLVASCSEYILIHDTRTGEVLQKINEQCSKVLSNNFGLFICQIDNQLKIFYVNGQLVKKVSHNKQKAFAVISDYLLLEDRENLLLLSLFDDDTKKKIVFQDPLEICYFHYTVEKDCLICVNRVENLYTAYSIEISLKQYIQNWL